MNINICTQQYRFALQALERGSLKYMVPILLVAAFAFAPLAAAESQSDAMQQLQSDVQFDRALAVANNMQLSEADKKIFWPVYESYLENLEQLNRSYTSIIQSYAFALRTATLTDDIAKQLADQLLAAQEAEVNLRMTYVTNLAKVLPGRTAARTLQLENKFRTIAWYDMVSRIPLVGQ